MLFAKSFIEMRNNLYMFLLLCCSHVDGCLYELDGRKAFPINHGPTTQDTLLSDACTVIKQFMERDPTELRFTIVALGGPASFDD